MLQNYFLSALRNIIKNPLFSLINIGGLAIGLGVCVLVFLFVERELNWDNWAQNSDNLYRVETEQNFQGNTYYNTSAMYPVRNTIVNEVPEVSLSSRFQSSVQTIQRGEAVFYERISSVDRDWLDMVSFEFLEGNKEGAINDRNSIVLSETLAKKYFGDENPLGQTLTFDGDKDIRVTGVIKDITGDSHLAFNAIMLFDENSPYINDWNSNGPTAYAQVDDPSLLPAINNQFEQMIRKYRPYMDDDEENPNDVIKIFLQPWKDIHLKSSGRTSKNPYGNLAILWGYVGIAVLILVISCINYVNLSTARAMKRTKEVCVRKVMGAKRGNLMSQFMGETIIIATLALSLGMGMVQLALPWLNELLNAELSLDLLSNGNLWVLLISIVAFTGFVAGFYPAVFVSSFQPSKFLHSNQSSAGPGSKLRNILVVVQFSVAIGLITSAGVIQAQMKLAAEADLGFDRENLIVIRSINRDSTRDQSDTIKSQLEKVRGVELVTRSYNVPTDGRYSGRTAVLRDVPPEQAPSLRIMPSDYEFLETLKVPLLAGRYLNENFANDNLISDDSVNPEEAPPANALLNESALKTLGIGTPDEAIGQTIKMTMGYGRGSALFTVVGVVEDFRFGTVKNGVDDMIFYRQKTAFDVMMLRVSPNSLPQVLGQIDETWKSVYPNVPIRRQLMEDLFEQRISREQNQSSLFLSFSLIAIALSCLGLLGLAVFAAENRIKEIGVRKVMGAGILDIVRLLTWQFSKPVILANIFAIPAAWYFANQWLENFVVRIDLNPTYFLVGGMIALMIGWFTIAGHAWHAARTHPIVALRYE